MNRKERLLEKTLSVIKNNIDNNDVKSEVFSFKLDEKINRRTNNYIKVCINRKEYEERLDSIMDYFIENEWYEDCVTIKEYKQKLNKLQNNEKQADSRTKTESVKG